MPGTTFTPGHASGNAALDQLNSMVTEVFMPKVIDQTKRDNPLWDRLYANKITQTGPDIAQPIRIRDFGGIEFFKGFQSSNMAYQPTDDVAKIDWTMIRVPVVVSLEDVVTAGRQDNGLGKLGARLMENAKTDLADIIGYALFINPNGTAATSGGAFTGGVALDPNLVLGANGITEVIKCASGTSTYAGIAGATYAAWNAQFDTATAATNANINKLFRACRTKGRGNVSLALSTSTVSNRLYAVNTAAQIMDVKTRAAIGYEVLVINGVDVMIDWHCPGGTDQPSTLTMGASTISNPLLGAMSSGTEHFFAISEDYLNVVVFPDLDMEWSGFKSQEVNGQASYVGYVYLRYNLIAKSRRAHGVAIYTT